MPCYLGEVLVSLGQNMAERQELTSNMMSTDISNSSSSLPTFLAHVVMPASQPQVIVCAASSFVNPSCCIRRGAMLVEQAAQFAARKPQKTGHSHRLRSDLSHAEDC